jgi:hypothetical protein
VIKGTPGGSTLRDGCVARRFGAAGVALHLPPMLGRPGQFPMSVRNSVQEAGFCEDEAVVERLAGMSE